MLTSEPEIIDRFYELFRGRKDAYGTWKGGRAQSYNSDGVPRPKAVTYDHFERHLTSNSEHDWIGIYPLGVEKCTWGCIDIDGKDFPTFRDGDNWDWDKMWDLAMSLYTLLKVKNVYAHLERTRNGIHVWIFPEEKAVSARSMRRAQMAACVAVDYKPKEINPKAERLDDGKIGNYVRLPYYGALAPENEGTWQLDRYFIDPEDPDAGANSIAGIHSLASFLESVKYTSTEALDNVAKLWTPPVKKYTVDHSVGLDAESMTRGLNGLGYTIWKDGPLPGSDRSSTLSHLAHLCNESGLTIQQGYAIVASADLRWGKFQPEGRSDAEEQLTAIVERAYAS